MEHAARKLQAGGGGGATSEVVGSLGAACGTTPSARLRCRPLTRQRGACSGTGSSPGSPSCEGRQEEEPLWHLGQRCSDSSSSPPECRQRLRTEEAELCPPVTAGDEWDLRGQMLSHKALFVRNLRREKSVLNQTKHQN